MNDDVLASLDRGIETITRVAAAPSSAGPAGPYGPFAFKRIVVGVDGSRQADFALAWAKEFGVRFEAHVWVVAVVPPEKFYGDAVNGHRDQAEAEAAFERDVTKALSTIDVASNELRRAHVRVDEEVLYGEAGATLVKFAQQQKAHLLITGSRGATGIERFLLGSVSEFVKDHAPMSVLVAKTPVGRDRILAPVDGSRSSRRSAGIAARLARMWGGHAMLLHVYQPPSYGSLVGPLATKPPSVPEASLPRESKELDYKSAVGTPAREIVRVAKDKDSDLIVMGSRGLGRMKRVLIGSVSSRVAREARTSVLIVKAA